MEEKNKDNHKSYVLFKRVEKYRKNYSYTIVFQYLRMQGREKENNMYILSRRPISFLTLLGLGLIKINTMSANFNNPRPSLILDN